MRSQQPTTNNRKNPEILVCGEFQLASEPKNRDLEPNAADLTHTPHTTPSFRKKTEFL